MTGIMGYDEILGNFESTYHMILVFLIFPSRRGGSVSVHRCFGQCFFCFPARAQGISDDSRSVALEGNSRKTAQESAGTLQWRGLNLYGRGSF